MKIDELERHNLTQYNDTQFNDTQHDDTQYNVNAHWVTFQYDCTQNNEKYNTKLNGTLH